MNQKMNRLIASLYQLPEGGWRRRSLNFLVGLTVAAVMLLLLEGALHLLPLDRWERDRPNSSYPVFVRGEGAAADYYVTNGHFKDAMSYSRFARVKATGAKRIFILGGSAALGWPGVPDTAFSGYMQRALETVAPGRYEVINAAGMSYGSHRVLDLLHDIVRLEPDLVVIWCGNNEYIERNSLSRYAGSAAMRGVQRLLRNSSLYRTVRLVLQSTAPALFARPSGADITDPRNVPLVRRGMVGRSAETDRQVRENYQSNINGMAQLLNENGIPGIFCTVPVNLSGWMPTDVVPEISDPDRAKEWQTLMDRAFSFGEQKQFANSAAEFEKVLAMTPQYAYGHYLLGTCLQNLGRYQEALREFEAACDLDPRPMRASSGFTEIIRSVAAQEGMRLVDLRRAMLEESGKNLSGLDLFLDYVHPNDAGHRFAAAVVLQEALPVIGPDLSLQGLFKKINEDDWIARNKINQAQTVYALGLTLFNNGDMEGAEQAYRQALQADPAFPEAAGNLGMIYDQRGDQTMAESFYLRALKNDPGTIYGGNLALLYYRQGKLAAARALGERLLQEGVVEVDVLILLGQIAFEEGRYREALILFEQAIAAGGDQTRLYKRIGDTYRKLGDEAKAEAAYSRAAATR